MHRINSVDKGMQTFKVHSKPVLCGLGGLFSLNLCDRLIPKKTQVKLLRQLKATAKVSEYVYLNVPDDFNHIIMETLEYMTIA